MRIDVDSGDPYGAPLPTTPWADGSGARGMGYRVPQPVAVLYRFRREYHVYRRRRTERAWEEVFSAVPLEPCVG